MKKGKTERETLDLNGWGVGDVLEGDEGTGPERIKVTAIGEETFLCRWFDRQSGTYRDERGNTTLNYRTWRKVDKQGGK